MSLQPPPSVVPGAGAGRAQVPLEPGHSMMDWMRLSQRKGSALAGCRPHRVTPEELAAHADPRQGDVWMALAGKVYNISPYLKFHPGGVDELLRGTGIDASKLFCEVHPWVNVESMLEKCLIGPLVGPSSQNLGHMLQSQNTLGTPSEKARPKTAATLTVPGAPVTITVSADAPATAPEPARAVVEVPRRDWYQSQGKISAVVYTRNLAVTADDITVLLDASTLQINFALATSDYQLLVQLTHAARPASHSVAVKSSCVVVTFDKRDPAMQWSSLGTPLQETLANREQSQVIDTPSRPEECECTVTGIKEVAHDSKLFTLRLPEGKAFEQLFGLGQHLRLQMKGLSGVVYRNYTPVTLPLGTQADASSPTIQLLIRLYSDGAMSQCLQGLAAGDHVKLTTGLGPVYQPPQGVKQLIMLAGGTGVTPMVQLLQRAACDEGFPAATLLYFNRREQDILLKDELAQLQAQYPDRCTVHHVLSQPHEQWTGCRGKVGVDLLRGRTPAPGPATAVVVCGRPGFTAVTLGLLPRLGHSTDRIHAFT
eukprot:m.90769 g.90769  ORF g.90769 m.90769 type:complete len:540 (+) comp15018_c0_seq2:193-1812(+)